MFKNKYGIRSDPDIRRPGLKEGLKVFFEMYQAQCPTYRKPEQDAKNT